MTPLNQNLNLPLHYARGMAIFLVVFGHALGPVRSGSVAGTIATAGVDVIFTFHMPLFMFLSGFFATKVFACRRNEAGSVVVRQFKRLMVVYFFYTTLVVAAKLVASNYVNRPIDLTGIVRAVLLYPHKNPLLDLWFLYALFSIQMLFLGVRVLTNINLGRGVPAATTLIVVVILNRVSRDIPSTFLFDDRYDVLLGIDYIAKYGLYFYLGFLASRHGDRVEQFLRERAKLLLLVGLCYFALAFAFHDRLQSWWPLNMFCALIGITLSWTLGVALAKRQWRGNAVVGTWSEYSYEIYLLGDLFQEATKIGFVRILGGPALANLPVSLVVGLLCPVLLSRYVIRRNRFLRRFAAGDWKT